MSVRTQAAYSEFGTAMADPHNLIWLHKNSQDGQGRRHRQTTLNRAVVVLTAAAWQAFVEDTARAIRDDLEVPQGSPNRPGFNVLKALTNSALGRYNTPDAHNTLQLLQNVGFDPRPHWTFTLSGPVRTYALADVRAEIDDWLRVRHKIAHGSALPPLGIITGTSKAGPTLRRSDAERCIQFFEQVASVTASAAHAQFP